MKTRTVIVGVLTALLPNLAAYAGESMSSSSATTLNQSASGNQASSSATAHTSSSAATSSSSAATTKASTQAGTLNDANRGTVVTRTGATAEEPKLYRARAFSRAKTYYPGYRKPGFKVKTSTAHWQTRTWR